MDNLPIFRRIRRQLMGWYTLVLSLALVVLGFALYIGMSRAVIGPVDDALHRQASEYSERWQSIPSAYCPLQDAFEVCYDASGHSIIAGVLAQHVPSLYQPGLAEAALQSGDAYATVDTRELGQMRLYAMSVHQGGGSAGVVQVGTPVGDRIQALHTLLILLVVLGLIALGVTTAAGFFLSGRSLVPAAVALERQREFVADVSHELRTPLTIMRSSAEVVLRDRARLPEDDAYLLEDIVGEAAHMGSIVDNMLNLTKLEGGNPRIEQNVMDTREIALRVLDRARVLAQSREVSVEADELTSAHILGDPALLEQAVMVFVDNAIKYNRAGGTVWIGSRARGQDAVIEVRDTGEGLAAADVERLGERFYRTDKARGRSTGGLGLGVTIGKRIVALHGGRVEVESALGQGTTIRLVLPRLRS